VVERSQTVRVARERFAPIYQNHLKPSLGIARANVQLTMENLNEPLDQAAASLESLRSRLSTTAQRANLAITAQWKQAWQGSDDIYSELTTSHGPSPSQPPRDYSTTEMDPGDALAGPPQVHDRHFNNP